MKAINFLTLVLIILTILLAGYQVLGQTSTVKSAVYIMVK